MKIIGIVCADNNWAIGKKNGLLYSLKTDMQHFKETTTDHFVICGYNTLLSFPNSKPLKNRITICVAPEGTKRDDCIIVSNLDNCFKVMRQNDLGNTEFYIIGGAMLYKSFLPYYDEVIVTKVDAEDSEATAFFPNLDKEKDFKIAEESEVIKDGQYNIKFVTYERIKR